MNSTIKIPNLILIWFHLLPYCSIHWTLSCNFIFFWVWNGLLFSLLKIKRENFISHVLHIYAHDRNFIYPWLLFEGWVHWRFWSFTIALYLVTLGFLKCDHVQLAFIIIDNSFTDLKNVIEQLFNSLGLLKLRDQSFRPTSRDYDFIYPW